MMASDEMRSATPYASLIRSRFNGGDQRGVISQPEIIVAAKGYNLTPIDLNMGALSTFQKPATAQQAGSLALNEALGKIGEKRINHRRDRKPRDYRMKYFLYLPCFQGSYLCGMDA